MLFTADNATEVIPAYLRTLLIVDNTDGHLGPETFTKGVQTDMGQSDLVLKHFNYMVLYILVQKL